VTWSKLAIRTNQFRDERRREEVGLLVISRFAPVFPVSSTNANIASGPFMFQALLNTNL
jgi:hypothetical protein